jgi:hypothetical protein
MLLAAAEAVWALASAYYAYQVSDHVLSVSSEGGSGSCSVEDVEYLSVVTLSVQANTFKDR